MIKIIIFCLSFILTYTEAKNVDIVSSFNIDELPSKFLNIKQEFNIRSVCPSDYFIKISPYDSNLCKIIVFDPFWNREIIPKLPKEKLVLVVWEPYILSSDFYKSYSKVYTWDDSLLDGKKFFKFNYPYLMPLRKDIPSFQDKKLCTMVTGHWTNQRLEILNFFKTVEFEFYGTYPKEVDCNECYKGIIPGQHSGEEKLSVLKNYRFCICFENTIGLQGYITEKIFGCFAAGCVPIYFGAANIEKYIPKACFIDYRDFNSNEQLYYYIKNMTEEVYQQYINEIRNYLQSEAAQVFSPEFFDELMLQAIIEN